MTLHERATATTTVQLDQIRPLLVNATRAAEILCIGRTALYQLIWNGELTPIHIGRSVRFPIEELEAFVRQRLAASHQENASSGATSGRSSSSSLAR